MDLSAWDGDIMKVHLANSNAWSDGNEYIMGIASEVHTNALFDIYPNDTTITADFKGNTEQNGTPSPSAPVPVVGVGYLDGTAYKIPVEIGLSTQSIDLSAVQTVRNIKKLILTGDETYVQQGGGTLYSYNLISSEKAKARDLVICSHLPFSWSYSDNICIHIYSSLATIFLNFGVDIMNAQPSGNTVAGLKEYLAQQYTNGTPVTIYYVLAQNVTDTINEPLQKIGDYADSISNITLTTTAGATSFGVDTAVKPSEITLNFRGWHPKDPKESTGGEWS